jgi:hypothetical protein
LVINPGVVTGTTEQAASTPALPKLAGRRAMPGSTMVTGRPLRSSQIAEDNPMMPPPITTTRFLLSVIRSLRLP